MKLKLLLASLLILPAIKTQSDLKRQQEPTDPVDTSQYDTPTQKLDLNYAPPCFNTTVCGKYCWSQWIDRDNPSGTGDWETLQEVANLYPNLCAKKPVMIQCQTTTGIPFYSTGQAVIYNAVDGCICRNSDNLPQGCKYDYKVRILCPC